MANKPIAMLKLRQVLRYFTEGTSKKQISKESEKELKPLFLICPNCSLPSFKKQQLRVVSLQRYRGGSICAFSPQ